MFQPGLEPSGDPGVEGGGHVVVEDGDGGAEDRSHVGDADLAAGEQFEHLWEAFAQIQAAVQGGGGGAATGSEGGAGLGDQLVPVVDEQSACLRVHCAGFVSQRVELGQHGMTLRCEAVLRDGDLAQPGQRLPGIEGRRRGCDPGGQGRGGLPSERERVIVAHVFESTSNDAVLQ